VVVAVTLLAAGSGYTSTPAIEIATPPFTALTPNFASAIRLDFTNLTTSLPYQIQSAACLNNWTNCGPPFFATAGAGSQYFPLGSGAGFFQLHYAP
jgi:hypothetical protein